MTQGRVVRAEEADFWTAGSNAEGRYELMVEAVEYLHEAPLHTHDVQEDSFFVLAGVVTVQIGDDVVELGRGDFAAAPAGVPHTFTNTDPMQTARMLNVMSPAIGFGDLIAAVRSGTVRRRDFERVAKEYGLTIVGPSLPRKLGLRE